MAPFDFDEKNVPRSSAAIARVKPGLQEPAHLFAELSEQLRFPDYFGANWNALEECIRDLSWLPPGPVVLMHQDVPLAEDTESQRIYLAILSDAIEKKWVVPGQHLRDLVVVFPPDTEELIERIANSKSSAQH